MQHKLFDEKESTGHDVNDSGGFQRYNALSKNDEQVIIDRALSILAGRLRQPEATLGHPTEVKNFARLKIGDKKHEVFGVFYLNSAHGLIGFEELFRGTLSQTSVYPREVVINALAHNAAAVIVTHNHPSGNTTPSRADEALTSTLKKALALVDVRVLDHIIVTADASVSMAEIGLM